MSFLSYGLQKTLFLDLHEIFVPIHLEEAPVLPTVSSGAYGQHKTLFPFRFDVVQILQEEELEDPMTFSLKSDPRIEVFQCFCLIYVRIH